MPSTHRPSRTALASRARAMLEQMTDRGRWIYALPPEEAALHLAQVLLAHGLRRDEEPSERPSSGDPPPESNPSRWSTPDGTGAMTVLVRSDLEVTLVEAQGAPAVAPLSELLSRTGFFAQSTLLESAFELGTEDSRRALTTLAHMVVAWDDDWGELFLLHLASPDPIVRHDAVAALCIAAMVARAPGPAPELLSEAARRESFPKLKETIEEALALVAAIAVS